MATTGRHPLLDLVAVLSTCFSYVGLHYLIAFLTLFTFSTIIHEGTHFPQVLGTDDYTYGESSCKSLAKSNPTNAVYNAECVFIILLAGLAAHNHLAVTTLSSPTTLKRFHINMSGWGRRNATL